MTAKIIDGKKIASEIRAEIKKKVSELKDKPGLAVVQVGSNEASKLYVSMKEKACHEVGFYSKKITLPEGISEEELMKKIDELNQDKKIHGILVQLPIAGDVNEQLIMDTILPHKDVDGFSAVNLGSMLQGNNIIVPATPKGIMTLLEKTGIELSGKHAVVVGRSNIVGKPISILLQQKNCTVTMCHSKTKPLSYFTKQADILIAATGKESMITGDMLKEGVVIIDVGSPKGDVEFESAKKVASYITPVPGGVGPMTIASLLENTLICYELCKKFVSI